MRASLEGQTPDRYGYPPDIEVERETHGTNRCNSPGAKAGVHELKGLVKRGRVVLPARTRPSSSGGDLWIFAVRGGVMRVARDGGSRRRGAPPLPLDAVKHETLFTNLPVAAAGEIQFTDGCIASINNYSGTYVCAYDFEFWSVIRQALLEARAPLTPEFDTRLRLELGGGRN